MKAVPRSTDLWRGKDGTVLDSGPTCLHHFAEAVARTSPDVVAWICGGETLTYGALERQANQLAHRLRRLGAGPEVPVGIFLERGLPLIVAIQGVLKAGGTYVPLDPNYPPERLSFMLEDSQARIVITQPKLLSRLPGSVPEILVLGSAGDPLADEPEHPPTPEAGPGNLAYLIYTSGSTGRPKGAAIQHRSPVALMRWAADFFSEEEAAGVLCSTSICFDVSVFELFLPATFGTTGVLVESSIGWLGLPEVAQVTLVSTAPSSMAELVRMGGLPAAVRTVALAGEALPGRLADDLYQIPTIERVCNLYGPSEDTTYSTWSVIPRQRSGPPAIGRPIAGGRVHLVDESFQPVSAGARGEILLGGVGLARGYLGRPDLTAERFVPDPFGDEPGERLYRTGDLGSCREDGELDFHGRIDHQVKIRGLRIEPGEIEAAIGSHPAVSEAAVVVQEARTGPLLVAFLTLQEGQTVPMAHLRDFLQTRLPSYMVPSRFVRLDRLPVTPNRKVDRRHLATLPTEDDDGAVSVPPRNRLELELAEIWAELLQVSSIGVTDNFFELGGHSLTAIHLVTGVRERYGMDWPLAVIFRAPTVEKMAALIAAAHGPDQGSHLVPLAGGAASGAPLFCVHGLGGHVFRLVPLARLLGAERPFFGIQGWADLDQIGHLGSIEEMAVLYVKAIRQTQPRGPYLLAGYSMGGPVAWEMGRLLTAAGESVDFLGLVDCEAPVPQPSADPEKTGMFEVALARELGFEVSLDRLRELSPQERLGHVVAEGIEQKVLPEGFTETDARRYIQAFHATAAAISRYTPKPWSGRATLFRTDEQRESTADPTLGWGALAGAVEVLDVPGDHVTLMRSPNVEVLAAAFSESLRRSPAALRTGSGD